MLSFHRAQPKFDEDATLVAPLPECLQSLLEKQVLVNAKQDELTKLRGLIEKDRKILNRIRYACLIALACGDCTDSGARCQRCQPLCGASRVRAHWLDALSGRRPPAGSLSRRLLLSLPDFWPTGCTEILSTLALWLY